LGANVKTSLSVSVSVAGARCRQPSYRGFLFHSGSLTSRLGGGFAFHQLSISGITTLMLATPPTDRPQPFASMNARRSFHGNRNQQASQAILLLSRLPLRVSPHPPGHGLPWVVT
jgi:hypothetical protein